MGLDIIPDRADGQKIDQTWFNVLKSVLSLDLVPRDATGTPTDQAGSLGSSTFRWLYAYLLGVYLYNGSRSVKLQTSPGMAADYTITLPAALPASGSNFLFVNNLGQASLNLGPDNTTIEIAGSIIRVKDGSITRAKLAALGQQVSSSCGAFSIATGNADITNLSATITTSGRPVFVGLISDGSGNDSNVIPSSTGNCQITFLQGSTTLAQHLINSSIYPVSSFWHIDTPVAGTYTYKAQALAGTSGTFNVNYARLIVFEL